MGALYGGCSCGRGTPRPMAIAMEHEMRRALLRELEAEEARVERENVDREVAMRQPLAVLVTGGYACEVLEDGTEVFRNQDVEVRVPPACVRRLRPPPGPAAMAPQRAALLREMRRGGPVPRGRETEAEAQQPRAG